MGVLGHFLHGVSGGVALDIGCGPGNILPVLAGRVTLAIGLDASAVSLALARQRAADPPAHVVRADALRLPFHDGSVDFVLASGSLHHTGDARRGFFEVGRVLAEGGAAYVSLYHVKSYYSTAYKTVGAIARAGARNRLAHLLINQVVLLPLFAVYFWVGRAVAHRRIGPPRYRHIVNYFADQLLNPVVSFHSPEEVRSWAGQAGLEVAHLSVSHAGALMVMVVRKTARRVERERWSGGDSRG
jgi:ubiquinone/menaquinone biosynthesis C-methylase UbiE